MRIALVHYWLVGMRGGEKVLQSLCRLFPTADIFTHVHDPAGLNGAFDGHRITQSFIGRLPMARRIYPALLPLMPAALEALDLRDYELILSSEAGPAKGVIGPPGVPHLCYVHSPMRYLWDQGPEYRHQMAWPARAMATLIGPRLRSWDVTSAARVDSFLAGSPLVAERIGRYWRRKSRVLPPPVDIRAFAPVSRAELGDFYLWAGQLAPYKRPDLVISAFRRLGLPLVVIGGPAREAARLADNAPSTVRFLGPVSDAVLRWHMARCRALVFPGIEDFGLVPVEVMASGRPVVAFGRGGAAGTVLHGETGLLYHEPGVEGLIEAVLAFEKSGLAGLDPRVPVARAACFDERAFHEGIRLAVGELGVVVGDAP